MLMTAWVWVSFFTFPNNSVYQSHTECVKLINTVLECESQDNLSTQVMFTVCDTTNQNKAANCIDHL